MKNALSVLLALSLSGLFAAAEAPKAITNLFGDELTDAKQEKVSVDQLSGKTIGIYFSAHWCPPCRTFTPRLVDFYNEMTKAGKPFQIVFVSSDKSESAMFNYMTETDMPWLALPFGDSHKAQLANKFNVTGIPKLVIIDAQGKLITENGRGDVSNKGSEAFNAWQ
jgi:nucleoredoxin